MVVLGLAFPAGSGDVEASPVLRLLNLFRRRVVDPRAPPRRPVVTSPLEPRTFDGADALVLMTPQPELVDFDYAAVADRMAHPVVVDACGGFHREFEAIGFRYHGLGRPSPAVLAERSLMWRYDHPWTPLEDIDWDQLD